MSEEKPKGDLTPTRAETRLDVAALVASAVPWIGGPVSNVLGGISIGRKLKRVSEVLEGVVEDLADFKSEVSKQYVKTEDFEELLEETLRRVGNERSEEKRQVYRAFLVGTIQSPGEPYNEQLRLLRILELLQADHLRVIAALDAEPEVDPRALSSSPLQTLSRRLPEYSPEQIEDRVTRLNDLRVSNLTSLKTMMTARGASDLRHAITPLGRSLLRFIVRSQSSDPQQQFQARMQSIKSLREAKKKRVNFRHSKEGVEATRNSTERVFQVLLELGAEHRDQESGYVFSHDRLDSGHLRSQLSLYAVGFTLRLDLQIPFVNSIEGFEDSNTGRVFENARIRMLIFDGVVRKGYISERQPEVGIERVYEYDVDGMGGEGWRLRGEDNDLRSPEAIATDMLTVFVEFAEANRTW